MRDIAAVLFDRFEMLDLYGPLQMFSYHRDDFRIVPIAADLLPKRANGAGPQTVPELTFDDRQDFDIVLVPGGTGTRAAMHDPTLLAWLSKTCAGAEVVASVCTGSLLLGKAGVLDGRRATTNKMAFSWVAEQVPSVDWQPKARWVEDAHVFTSSGVSAGMDMALAVLERLLGADEAEKAALWSEYIRNADADSDPFAKELT